MRKEGEGRVKIGYGRGELKESGGWWLELDGSEYVVDDEGRGDDGWTVE